MTTSTKRRILLVLQTLRSSSLCHSVSGQSDSGRERLESTSFSTEHLLMTIAAVPNHCPSAENWSMGARNVSASSSLCRSRRGWWWQKFPPGGNFLRCFTLEHFERQKRKCLVFLCSTGMDQCVSGDTGEALHTQNVWSLCEYEVPSLKYESIAITFL